VNGEVPLSIFLAYPLGMLDLKEALDRILAAVPAASGERVKLADAHGRVLLERVVSRVDLPGFDNSSMDGYAVRSADARAASAKTPVRLRVAGKIPAGRIFEGEVTAGACVRLFTGAALPGGADAVVRQEDTRVDPAAPGEVLILEPVEPGEHVRRRGEDVARGATLAEAGEEITAGRLALLGAGGVAEVSVGRQPAIGLMATGSELKEPGQELAAGQIYESNRLALAGLIREAGAAPKLFPLVADTLAATRAALEAAFSQCDAVVTSGGVSVGEMDFIRQAVEEAGGKLEFWRVAMKPGRPFLLARYREKLLFGLPGNPVSAFVTFLLLVRPALRRWQGAAEIDLPSHLAVLAEPIANDGPRPHFVRVRVDAAGQVHSAGMQASHALGSLAAANALVEVPPSSSLPAGSTVRVLRWSR